MTSVERIQEYYKVPPETTHHVSRLSAGKDWPTSGSITFTDLSFAHYNSGPVVLHGISLHIHSQEKVNIAPCSGKKMFGVSAFLLFRFLFSC